MSAPPERTRADASVGDGSHERWLGREWLEADGLGGFASGPVVGPRTRRYHAVLLAAWGSAARRYVLVNGLDAVVETAAGAWPLTTQAYVGGDVPAVEPTFEGFAPEPWPCWHHRLPDGTRIAHELFAVRGRPWVFLAWRLVEGGGRATLRVRPFLSGRDYHALQHENPAFRFAAERAGDHLLFRPYDGVPAIAVGGNGVYRHEPYWYRRFHYREEAARGLDAEEDLAAPGEWRFDLAAGEAWLSLAAEPALAPVDLEQARAAESARRRSLASPLERAAEQYVALRPGGGETIIAGYPWFTDWGRDTFIAVRGLCLATGRRADARAILLRWSDAVSEGMLPNRFPDGDDAPEYNSVDAALWYAVAVHDLVLACETAGDPLPPAERERLSSAVERILVGHVAGTRSGIRVTDDGLLAAGAPGLQLTWMDAKVGERVVTPRCGKPVEVQALWLNALWIGAALDAGPAARWREMLAAGRASFAARFWNAGARCLHDVVDVEHQPGTVDASFRPNQILAVGGLPMAVLDGERARQVVDAVEARLLTPLGLRSLAPGEPGYEPRYGGDPAARDGAYHQGTVWPWLMGPFVEAWLRVRGASADARGEARRRFVEPLRAHLFDAGVGHLPEVASAEPPFAPGGCPFQAWSLGELLRIERLVSDPPAPAGTPSAAP